MATIRSALALYDGMTGPLRSIHNAMSIVINSFESMQDASRNAIDASAIQEAREELVRAGAQMDELEQNIRRAGDAQNDFNDSIRDGADAADDMAGMFDQLKNAAAALGIGAGVKQLVDLADEIGSTRARLSLIVDGVGSIADLEQRLGRLNQTSTVTVNASDGGTVAALTDEMSALEQDRTAAVTVTDSGAAAALEQRLENLPDEKSVAFIASDGGSISSVERQIQNVVNQRDVIFTAADNGSIAAVNRQIEAVDREAVVAVQTTGENRIAQLDRQANALNQQALVTVSATDNGSIAALDAQVNGLNREAGVTVDVAANVTDNDSVKILEQKIMASAQRSRAAYLDTANAIANMGANASAAFATNDELIAFMEQVNKQFVIGGASAEGQAAAMLQLTQAMAAGALRGEELNSILENAPGIARAIESYMGTAEGSIKSYAEKGVVTAEVVKNAMFAAADETNAKFESMPRTWAQVWTGMQNQAITILDPLLTKISELANLDMVRGAADGLMNAFALVAETVSSALDLITSVGETLYTNWEWISPIILGVAGAFVVLKGAMLAYNIVQGISNGLTALHAAHTMLAAGATFTETAAQYGLNAALLACPITWIVIGIIALIAAFYAAVAAVNHFAGTSVSATGIICGVFMSALAFVGNLFVAFFNLVADVFALIYNLVATVANFIGNVFDDPVGAVCRLFFDLADTVLSVLESLASAIDTIFGSNLAGAVQGWRNSLGGWVDDTFGRGTEVMAKMNPEDLHLDRFEYGAAFDLGYDFGQGIENKISDAFDFGSKDLTSGLPDSLLQQQPAASPFDLSSLDSIGKNTGDTAANTAAAANALDYLDEDLEWMKDIAERDAINRFTTAEITVDMSGMRNSISNGMDLDGIIDGMIDGVNEAVEIAAEGVHA